MFRRNMAPYIAERLLFYKKQSEGLNNVSDLFPDDLDDQKVTLKNFEYRFNYIFDRKKNSASLRINISPLDMKSKSKLEREFEIKYFPQKVKKDNLIIKSFKHSKDDSGKDYFIFDTELVSVNDKPTYESVFEHFVKPFI